MAKELKLNKRIKNTDLVNKPNARIMRYNRKAIAKAKGVSIFAVHKAIQRGILDPTDLKSVSCYICRQKERR